MVWNNHICTAVVVDVKLKNGSTIVSRDGSVVEQRHKVANMLASSEQQ